MKVNRPETTPNPEGDRQFLKEELEKATGAEQAVVKKIAAHIDKVWQENYAFMKPIRKEMVALLRRVRGEYDPELLQAIRAFKGSETYVRNGENKARAATSWIEDIYRGVADLPWTLEPTAEPTLPDETVEQIKAATMAQMQTIEQDLAARGVEVSRFDVAKLVNDYYQEQLDKAKEDLNREAVERCKRVEKAIRDQNQEGGWAKAFKDFLYFFVRLHYGVIKGPIMVKRVVPKWVVGEGGSIEFGSAEELAYTVYSPSPFNFFPSEGMKTTGDGNTIELHELSRQGLSDLIGVPGYSEEEIRAVLAKNKTGKIKGKWLSLDDEKEVKRVTVEAKTPGLLAGTTDRAILAQEFYGTVSGAMLIEWDTNGELGRLDEAREYQVNCWKIGEHVIKCVLSPDPLNRKPYHVSSWAKNPDSLIGEGLLAFSGPVEDALNAIIRALINNIAIASGPMSEEDADRIEQDIPIYPWRRIRSTSSQMKSEGPAINYYQPQMHCQELISAYTFFSQVLDDMTVPAYTQGASQTGVTAGTASVFTQLLAAAARSIKAVAANIDEDIITPYVRMCYDYNMKFTEDETLKGDANVVAKGVSGLQAKEQQAQRKVEFLQVTANPTYQQILGAKNIGSVLKQVAESNDIHLPDDEHLSGDATAEELLTQLINAQAGVDPMQANGQIAAGGGAPAQPAGMNPDGSKAGVVNG